MFNLDKLNVIKGADRDKESYSFVGIKRNVDSNEMEFWLPIGFEDFPEDNRIAVKTLFFRMYKTLNIFSNSKISSKLNFKSKNRDGLIQSSGGFKLSYRDEADVVCYSKILMLETIIESYDDLKISSIIKTNVNSEDISFNDIHKYMHKAAYLEDDFIYIDKMKADSHKKNLRIQS